MVEVFVYVSFAIKRNEFDNEFGCILVWPGVFLLMPHHIGCDCALIRFSETIGGEFANIKLKNDRKSNEKGVV